MSSIISVVDKPEIDTSDVRQNAHGVADTLEVQQAAETIRNTEWLNANPFLTEVAHAPASKQSREEDPEPIRAATVLFGSLDDALPAAKDRVEPLIEDHYGERLAAPKADIAPRQERGGMLSAEDANTAIEAAAPATTAPVKAKKSEAKAPVSSTQNVEAEAVAEPYALTAGEIKAIALKSKGQRADLTKPMQDAARLGATTALTMEANEFDRATNAKGMTRTQAEKKAEALTKTDEFQEILDEKKPSRAGKKAGMGDYIGAGVGVAGGMLVGGATGAVVGVVGYPVIFIANKIAKCVDHVCGTDVAKYCSFSGVVTAGVVLCGGKAAMDNLQGLKNGEAQTHANQTFEAQKEVLKEALIAGMMKGAEARVNDPEVAVKKLKKELDAPAAMRKDEYASVLEEPVTPQKRYALEKLVKAAENMPEVKAAEKPVFDKAAYSQKVKAELEEALKTPFVPAFANDKAQDMGAQFVAADPTMSFQSLIKTQRRSSEASVGM